MEAFGHEHKNSIVKALKDKGYSPKMVQPKNLYI
jgi:threonine dehydratase